MGDLDLGLAGPAWVEDGCKGGGRLTEEGLGGFAEAVAFGVSTFPGCLAFLSGVFAGKRGADFSVGVCGALAAEGDFANFAVDLLDDGAERGASVSLGTGFAPGFSACLPLTSSWSLSLFVPFTGPTLAFDAELLSEALASSTASFTGAGSGSTVAAAAGGLPLGIFGCASVPSLDGGTAASKLVSFCGDTGTGCSWGSIFDAFFGTMPAKMFELTGLSGGLVASVSPLSFRVDEKVESWLVSRCSPILPSPSIAIIFVRTLERGLGD